MATVINFLKKKETVEQKKAIVFNFILGYCKEKAAGGVNIPYFLEARDMYNKMITNLKDLNHYYNKIISKRYK